jgi:hypothetical protein
MKVGFPGKLGIPRKSDFRYYGITKNAFEYICSQGRIEVTRLGSTVERQIS